MKETWHCFYCRKPSDIVKRHRIKKSEQKSEIMLKRFACRKCYEYGKTRHFAKNCKLRRAKDEESPKKNTMLVSTSSVLLTVPRRNKSSKWMLDSACTSPVTNSQNSFVSFNASRGAVKVGINETISSNR